MSCVRIAAIVTLSVATVRTFLIWNGNGQSLRQMLAVAGEPVPIDEVPEPHVESRSTPPEGECIIPTTALRELKTTETKNRVS